MVLKLPKAAKLESYGTLYSQDPEQDFFNNIIHVQKYRTARALSRFTLANSSGYLSEVIAIKIFLPLFFNLLFGEQEGKGENVKRACLEPEAIASIAGCMNWKECYKRLMSHKHRRARALSRFMLANSSGYLSEAITIKIFLPLFFNLLFGVQEGKGENVKSACLEAIASIAGCVNWKECYKRLMCCFRDLTVKRERQKSLLRLFSSMLDHFHFLETGSNHKINDTAEDFQLPKLLKACLQVLGCENAEDFLVAETETLIINL